MAIEKLSTGIIKPGADEILIPILIDDLSELPEDLAMLAIEKHNKTSKWWPHISDLLKLVEPEIEAKKNYLSWLAHERKTMAYMLDGADEKSTKRITSAFAQQGVEMAKPKDTAKMITGFVVPEMKKLT